MHFCAHGIVQYPGASRLETRVVYFSEILELIIYKELIINKFLFKILLLKSFI